MEDESVPDISDSVYGVDPASNPRLATIIATAKKAGLPKSTMESAIARGAGKSLTGASLESVTIEAMLPSSVAAIIECQTDNNLRTRADIRLILKEFGGTVSPTKHLFERQGKITLEKAEGFAEEDILDQAIEAGAWDVGFNDDGQRMVVYTDPQRTSSVAEALAKADGIRYESSDIVWSPNKETLVQNAPTEMLADFVGRYQQMQFLVPMLIV